MAAHLSHLFKLLEQQKCHRIRINQFARKSEFIMILPLPIYTLLQPHSDFLHQTTGSVSVLLPDPPGAIGIEYQAGCLAALSTADPVIVPAFGAPKPDICWHGEAPWLTCASPRCHRGRRWGRRRGRIGSVRCCSRSLQATSSWWFHSRSRCLSLNVCSRL